MRGCSVCAEPGHYATRHFPSVPRPYVRKPKTREQQRAGHVWTTYRIRWDDYCALIEQGCAICGKDISGKWEADVDHDHACDHPDKGQQCCRACVRGLLCRRDNLGVGRAERGESDDPRYLRYLMDAARSNVIVMRPEMQATLF